MSDDLKELFPEWYAVYLRIIEHPPGGKAVRKELLGESGFANLLEYVFLQQKRPEE